MTARPALPPCAPHARGFTLVELMVAVALGLLLVSALTALVVSTVNNRTELDKTMQRIENGRYALQTIGRDVEFAGFVGQSGNAWEYAQTGSACPGATLADYGYAAPDHVPVPVQQVFPTLPVTPLPACLAGQHVKNGTPVLLVTRVSSATTPVASAVAGELYVQVSNCKEQTEAVPPLKVKAGFAGAASTFDLQTHRCLGSELMPLRKAVHRLYFISDCNRCGKDEVPTLKVLDYAQGQPQVTAVAEGIERMRFTLGIDTDGNDGIPDASTAELDPPTMCGGSEDGYVDPYPASGATTRWDRVVAMRIEVLARAADRSAGREGAAYKRQIDCLTVRLNNPSEALRP